MTIWVPVASLRCGTRWPSPGVPLGLALVLFIGLFAIVRGVAVVGTAISLGGLIESAWLYVLSGIISIVFGAHLIVAPGDGALERSSS